MVAPKCVSSPFGLFCVTGMKALTTQNLYIFCLCPNIELASPFFFYKEEAFVCKTSQAKSLFTPWFVSLFI